MASSASKMQFKRSMTKKSHSWWWDSHNIPKNSKWLAQNLEKMDDRVKQMLKLIEEDADSFSKKAQLYFQKRPELVQLVEEFYRMYRALAERYDQASGELQKNHSSEIQSQSSFGLSSPTQEKLSHRGLKDEEDSSSLTDSGSDTNHSSDNDEDGDEALIRRMAELQLELQETKQKLLLLQHESDKNVDLLHKITVYEGELREANEKMRMYEEDISNLKIELQIYMSIGTETHQKSLDFDKEDDAATKVQVLEEELSITKGKLQHFEKETYSLRNELEITKTAEEKLKSLQHELELAHKDTDSYINLLNTEKEEVSKLQESLTMVKTSLQDRDNEISALKIVVSEMEDKLRGEAEKIKVMKDERNVGREEVGKREEKIKEMEKQMEELHMEQMRLRRRSSELTEEVERKRVATTEVVEQKREAIRQLCRSLDHYRNGYDRLWRIVAGDSTTIGNVPIHDESMMEEGFKQWILQNMDLGLC